MSSSPDSFFKPSITSTFLAPTRGVSPPPMMGVAPPSTGVGASCKVQASQLSAALIALLSVGKRWPPYSVRMAGLICLGSLSTDAHGIEGEAVLSISSLTARPHTIFIPAGFDAPQY